MEDTPIETLSKSEYPAFEQHLPRAIAVRQEQFENSRRAFTPTERTTTTASTVFHNVIQSTKSRSLNSHEKRASYPSQDSYKKDLHSLSKHFHRDFENKQEYSKDINGADDTIIHSKPPHKMSLSTDIASTAGQIQPIELIQPVSLPPPQKGQYKKHLLKKSVTWTDEVKNIVQPKEINQLMQITEESSRVLFPASKLLISMDFSNEQQMQVAKNNLTDINNLLSVSTESDRLDCRERNMTSSLPVAQSPLLFLANPISPFARLSSLEVNQPEYIRYQNEKLSNGPRISPEKISKPSQTTLVSSILDLSPQNKHLRSQLRSQTTKRIQNQHQYKVRKTTFIDQTNGINVPNEEELWNSVKMKKSTHDFNALTISSEGLPTMPRMQSIKSKSHEEEDQIGEQSSQSISKFRTLEKGLLLHFRGDPHVNAKEDLESVRNTLQYSRYLGTPTQSYSEMPSPEIGITSRHRMTLDKKFTGKQVDKLKSIQENPNLRQSIHMPYPVHQHFKNTTPVEKKIRNNNHIPSIHSSDFNSSDSSSQSSSSSSSSQSSSNSPEKIKMKSSGSPFPRITTFQTQHSQKMTQELRGFTGYDNSPKLVSSLVFDNDLNLYKQYNFGTPDKATLATLKQLNQIKKQTDSVSIKDHQTIESGSYLRRFENNVKNSHRQYSDMQNSMDMAKLCPLSFDSQTTNLVPTKPFLSEFGPLPKFIGSQLWRAHTAKASIDTPPEASSGSSFRNAQVRQTSSGQQQQTKFKSQFEFSENHLYRIAKQRTSDIIKSVSSLFEESPELKPRNPSQRPSMKFMFIEVPSNTNSPSEERKSPKTTQSLKICADDHKQFKWTNSMIEKQEKHTENPIPIQKKQTSLPSSSHQQDSSFQIRKSMKIVSHFSSRPHSPLSSSRQKQAHEFEMTVSQKSSFREYQAGPFSQPTSVERWNMSQRLKQNNREVDESVRVPTNMRSTSKKKSTHYEITASKIDFSAISFKSEQEIGISEPQYKMQPEQSLVQLKKRKKSMAKSTYSIMTGHLSKGRASNLGVMKYESGICQSCKDDCEELFILSSRCQNPVCADCIRSYIEELITNNDILKIRCPFISCNHKLRSENFKQFISHEYLKKYKRLKKLLIKRKNPHIRYCTQVNCGGYMIGSEDQPKLTCPKCYQDICYRCCNNWHQGRRCDQALEEEENPAENEDKIECPKCHHIAHGSNHFLDERANQQYSNKQQCANCSHEFCKLCHRSCGKYHFEPWNLCFGCPGQKYSPVQSGHQRLLCMFLWGLMKLIMYLILAILILVVYPIIIALVSLIMPLILYAYFFGQRRQYSGWRKYLLLTGLFLLGLLLYPIWLVYSIAPGTCLFFKDIYRENHLKDQGFNKSQTIL